MSTGLFFLAARQDLHHCARFLSGARSSDRAGPRRELGEIPAKVIERRCLRLLLALGTRACAPSRTAPAPTAFRWASSRQRLRRACCQVHAASVRTCAAIPFLPPAASPEQQMLGADVGVVQPRAPSLIASSSNHIYMPADVYGRSGPAPPPALPFFTVSLGGGWISSDRRSGLVSTARRRPRLRGQPSRMCSSRRTRGAAARLPPAPSAGPCDPIREVVPVHLPPTSSSTASSPARDVHTSAHRRQLGNRRSGVPRVPPGARAG